MRPIPPPYLRAAVCAVLNEQARELANMALGLAVMAGIDGATHHLRVCGLLWVASAIYGLLSFDHYHWAQQIEQADRPRGRS